jgi:hypothetical protein
MSPDIAMCSGTDCPKRETCYRATAKPSPHWQSYMHPPRLPDGTCEYYWPTTPNPERTT